MSVEMIKAIKNIEDSGYSGPNNPSSKEDAGICKQITYIACKEQEERAPSK